MQRMGEYQLAINHSTRLMGKEDYYYPQKLLNVLSYTGVNYRFHQMLELTRWSWTRQIHMWMTKGKAFYLQKICWIVSLMISTTLPRRLLVGNLQRAVDCWPSSQIYSPSGLLFMAGQKVGEWMHHSEPMHGWTESKLCKSKVTHGRIMFS